MINLSLDELKLVAKNRNIGDCETKFKEDLIKVLSEPKPKIKIDENNLEEIGKYFNELRHKFSKKEIDKYKIYLSVSKTKKAKKKLTKLKKSLKFKKFHGDIDSVDYDYLDIRMIIMMLFMMINTEKLKALEDYLKSSIKIIKNQ